MRRCAARAGRATSRSRPPTSLIAAVVALLLWRLGAAIAAAGGRAVGGDCLFLLLSNPAFARLGGVSVRAQCETFIAAAVTGAFRAAWRAAASDTHARRHLLAAGVLFGLAFAFKYNAAVYALAGVLRAASLEAADARGRRGCSRPDSRCRSLAVRAVVRRRSRACATCYEATITYNLRYSGETYAGPVHAVCVPADVSRSARPGGRAVAGRRRRAARCCSLPRSARRERLVAVAWVAAACLSIAINGSRDLPQYFVQAAPALALRRHGPAIARCCTPSAVAQCRHRGRARGSSRSGA